MKTYSKGNKGLLAIKSTLLIALTLLFFMDGKEVFAAGFSERTTAPSLTDSYYTAPLNNFSNDNGKGNCTWYAYGRAYEILGKAPVFKGNAEKWWNYKDSYYGYGDIDHPKVGAIAVWGGDYGHVAVVERVNSDGTVVLSSSSWGGVWFTGTYWGSRTYKKSTILSLKSSMGTLFFQGYIYLLSDDKNAPTISDSKVTNITSTGYTVTCNVSDNVGVTSVKFPTWTANNDQDDLVWYDGTINGNTATINIQTSNHKNEVGVYFTHIYAYDAAGNSSNTGVTADIPKKDSSKPTSAPTVTPIITPAITPIPTEENIAKEIDTAEVAKDSSVLVTAVTSPEELQNLIDTDLEYSIQEEFDDEAREGNVYQIEIQEEGWLLFNSSTKNPSGLDVTLYSNKSLTSAVNTYSWISNNNALFGFYVAPGVYYYQVTGSAYTRCKITTFIGFMPSYSRIKVGNVEYSKDKSKAVIELEVDEDYYLSEGVIRLARGKVSYKDLNNGNVWGGFYFKDNIITSDTYTITENGIYTFRITSKRDSYYCMYSFEINDIVSSKPKAPAITSYKKNSTKVSGTGLSGATVYIRVGVKDYKAEVDKSGKWSVSVPKLKKGSKLTASVKNAAGVKSKTTSVTVK